MASSRCSRASRACEGVRGRQQLCGPAKLEQHFQVVSQPEYDQGVQKYKTYQKYEILYRAQLASYQKYKILYTYVRALEICKKHVGNVQQPIPRGRYGSWKIVFRGRYGFWKMAMKISTI